MTEQGHQDALKGRTIIGIAERIDLPDWGVDQLRVKIDTGAKTSALHVDAVEELPGDRVRFWVVLDRKQAHRRVQVEAKVSRRSRVRSSSGRAEDRIFVTTRMRLGPVEKDIEISLASREPMIFRMLLGRGALQHDFLVDPTHRYLKTPKVRRSKAAPAVEDPPTEAKRTPAKKKAKAAKKKAKRKTKKKAAPEKKSTRKAKKKRKTSQR